MLFVIILVCLNTLALHACYFFCCICLKYAANFWAANSNLCNQDRNRHDIKQNKLASNDFKALFSFLFLARVHLNGHKMQMKETWYRKSKEEATINTQDYIEKKNCFFECSILFLRSGKTFCTYFEIHPISVKIE